MSVLPKFDILTVEDRYLLKRHYLQIFVFLFFSVKSFLLEEASFYVSMCPKPNTMFRKEIIRYPKNMNNGNIANEDLLHTKSSAIVLSVISPSPHLHVISEIMMYCNVTNTASRTVSL